MKIISDKEIPNAIKPLKVCHKIQLHEVICNREEFNILIIIAEIFQNDT